MIPKRFDLIDESDIMALIENQVREGRTIEYKSELPGTSDDDKRKFLAEVSSFANAGGGDLLYGIVENEGIPQEAVGLSITNIDAEKNRLEQIIRTGIEPRIPGIQMKFIGRFTKGPVLLIRVPKSWAAPHMVTFKNFSRFYTRNSAGKHQMDVTELRAAFLLSETITEKMKRFRDERLGRIIANETPVPLRENTKIILHILPVDSFTSEHGFNMSILKERVLHTLKPIGSPAYLHKYCLEGLVTYSEGDAYTLLFRTGQIEAVCTRITTERHDRKVIPNQTFEKYTVKAVLNYFNTLRSLDIEGPVVISVCLTKTRGIYLSGSFNAETGGGEPIDRDTLLLPDVFLEDYKNLFGENVIAKVLRPIFDAFWNACGFECSFNYDEEGNWNL